MNALTAIKPVKPVIIRDYRYNEGWAAYNLGFTGPNPYPSMSESARLWAEGFTANRRRHPAQPVTDTQIMANALRRIADESHDETMQIIARNALAATA